MSEGGNLWQTIKSWFVKDDDSAEAMEEVDLMIKEMQDAIVSATSSIASVVRNEKKLEVELKSVKLKSSQSESAAKRALDEGDEEAARGHLMEKSSLEKRRVAVEKTYNEVKSTSSQLRNHVTKLNIELDSWQSRKSLLQARVKNAEARSEMARKKMGIDKRAMDDLQRLEDKLLDLEAETDAMEETANLDVEIRQDLDDDWINQEMDRLRNEG